MMSHALAGVETVRAKVGEDEHGNPEYATGQKVKLSDRFKRLELIDKHIDVQTLQEKLEHSGAMMQAVSAEDAGL